MKGTNLGEFEELVLLTIAALVNDAYSVAICDALEKNTGRSAKLGVVHAVLNRLEEKRTSEKQTGRSHQYKRREAKTILFDHQRWKGSIDQIQGVAGSTLG